MTEWNRGPYTLEGRGPTVGVDMQAEQTHAHHMALVKLREQGKRDLIETGKHLYYIEKDKEYLASYGGYNSYLASPEIDLGWSQAYKYRRVYELYCVELGVHPSALYPVGITKLDKMKKVVDKNDVYEWITKAELSVPDLDKEIASAESDNEAMIRKYAARMGFKELFSLLTNMLTELNKKKAPTQ